MPATGREENLKSFSPEDPDRARELGSKGGKKSAETKRQQREFRRAFELLLEKKYEVKDPKKKTGLSKLSGTELLAAKVMDKALRGDLTAFTLIRDTIGQKPIDKALVGVVDPDTLEEVGRLVKEVSDE